MHWAARHNSICVATVLLFHGADKDPPNNDGSTPLHFAACNKNPDFV